MKLVNIFPNKTRGLAIGIVVAMASIGYFFSPMYTKFALSEFGWEKTLQTFLYIIIFGMIAGIFLFPVRKDKIGSANIKTHEQTIPEALKEAFNHKGFILLIFGFFVCGFNITLVSAHIPGYIQERGFELWTAFAILSLIGLFNIFGTLTFGYLSGKYSKKILLSILYFSRGIVLILFLVLPTSTIRSSWFWNSLWLSLAFYNTTNKRYYISDFWNQIFSYVIWASIFWSSNRLFFWSLSWWIFF